MTDCNEPKISHFPDQKIEKQFIIYRFTCYEDSQWQKEEHHRRSPTGVHHFSRVCPSAVHFEYFCSDFGPLI